MGCYDNFLGSVTPSAAYTLRISATESCFLPSYACVQVRTRLAVTAAASLPLPIASTSHVNRCLDPPTPEGHYPYPCPHALVSVAKSCLFASEHKRAGTSTPCRCHSVPAHCTSRLRAADRCFDPSPLKGPLAHVVCLRSWSAPSTCLSNFVRARASPRAPCRRRSSHCDYCPSRPRLARTDASTLIRPRVTIHHHVHTL